MSKKQIPAPQYRSATGRYTNWIQVVLDAIEFPEQWLLVPVGTVPIATARGLRYRRDLQPRAGRILWQTRNPHIHEGRTEADLYVKFTTQEDTP